MRWLLRLATPLAALMLVHCGGSSTPNNANPPLPPPLPTYLSFQESGAMSTNRSAFCATLLADGKVLVTGGYDTTAELDSAECFDPDANGGKGSFTSLSVRMSATRYRHTATLLLDGTVLITGGRDASFNSRQTAELYIPSPNGGAGVFQPLAKGMTTPRAEHVATRLKDGRVLITGGTGGNVLSSAEIYDPATHTFTATGSMTSVRVHHTATLLTDGKVLITGGDQGSAGQGTECFDPTLGNGTGGFTAQGTMSKTRYFHAAGLLPNGQVLISGGSSSGPIASMDLYSPGTSTPAGSVAPASPMLTARSTHSQTTLPNGQVLLAGGAGSSAATPQSTEWFNPAAAPGSALSPGPQMLYPRSGHLTVLLKNQALLVLGGGKPIAEILK